MFSTLLFLTLMAIAACFALLVMSYMASEQETFGAWARGLVGRGPPTDERALQKLRAAKMDRLLNERVRVKSTSNDKGDEGKARARKTAKGAKEEKKKDR